MIARGKICADNVTHIKISNKLTPSINYFLNTVIMVVFPSSGSQK